MRDLLYRETVNGTVSSILTAVFFCLFTALIFHVYRSSRRSLYREIEQFPLRDGEQNENVNSRN